VHEDYYINIEGDVLIIEKLTYPRLIVKVDYIDPLLPVESIRVLEEYDPPDVQDAVREIRHYLELMV
jgi:hypothetical protein